MLPRDVLPPVHLMKINDYAESADASKSIICYTHVLFYSLSVIYKSEVCVAAVTSSIL